MLSGHIELFNESLLCNPSLLSGIRDTNGRLILTILASVAEEESHSKSIIMNWSVDRRFQRGLFLTPELLGYDRDENGNLVINPEEAETVKVIFYLYLNGYSFKEIAELLTDYGRRTKLGNAHKAELMSRGGV